MKKRKVVFSISGILTAILLHGCLADEFKKIEDEKLVENLSFSGFNFSMISNHSVGVSCLGSQDEALRNVYLELYLENPLNDSGLFDPEASAGLAFKGVTDSLGFFEGVINNTLSDSLFIVAFDARLPFVTGVPVAGQEINVIVGGKASAVANVSSSKSSRLLSGTLSGNDIKDADGDGVIDGFDQHPQDKRKAFNNYCPAERDYGSLVFEDLWPYRGDYDFNDLVLDYKFNQITNAANAVVAIEGYVVVRAIGATYKNAFGVSLNTSPSNISSVTGAVNKFNYLNIASNGTESNQSLATIIFFDDVSNVLPHPGTGSGTNTYPGNPFSTPDTVIVRVEFVHPVKLSVIGTPPYNPFIIVNRNRNVEVHLPMTPPTDLADKSLFGLGQDNSVTTGNKQYVSDKNLPWALNIPVSFDYPIEKENIMQVYQDFKNWAISHGVQSPDWYLKKEGARNEDLIYKKQ